MDQDPAPDPTPDLTTFFIDFKDAKKTIFFLLFFFLITCPQSHHLQTKKLNFFLKFLLKFYFAGIIPVRSTHL